MLSIFNNLRTDRQYKASTGLSKAEFEELYAVFEKLYIPKTANPYTSNHPPVLTDKKEALFFILHYYKSYPTLQNMGLYFGFSDFTASTYLELLKPILKASLQSKAALKAGLFENQSEFNKVFEGVSDIFIDVTEIPVQRPQNDEIQKKSIVAKNVFIRLNG
jgi:Helix-turn-helix of DDE superfamily endonuclease